jgi:hypothetical protein
MPNTLRSTIDHFATALASSIVAAVKAASLDEILSLSANKALAPAARPSAPRAAAKPARPVKKTAPKPSAAVAKTRALTAAPAKVVAPQTKKAVALATATRPKAVTAPKKTAKGGRLRRRSPGEIAKALAAVVALVKKNPKGLRAEQIRDRLKMEAKEMPRVLQEGLGKRALKRKGQKRSTTYTAA